MTVQFEFWQFLSMVGASFVFFFGVGSHFVGRMERRMDERFAVFDRHREKLDSLERDFLKWLAELPLQYLRREDYVRNQTIIEAKLDALNNKLDEMRMRRGGGDVGFG